MDLLRNVRSSAGKVLKHLYDVGRFVLLTTDLLSSFVLWGYSGKGVCYSQFLVTIVNSNPQVCAT
jgi:hypothetical protein